MQDRFLFVQNDIIIESKRFAGKDAVKKRLGQTNGCGSKYMFCIQACSSSTFPALFLSSSSQAHLSFLFIIQTHRSCFLPSSPSHTSPHMYYMCACFFVTNYTALGLGSCSWLLVLVLALALGLGSCSWLLLFVLALGLGSCSWLLLALGSCSTFFFLALASRSCTCTRFPTKLTLLTFASFPPYVRQLGKQFA